jgi:hypothetical protein
MPTQHTDESFRADDVRFRIAVGAVVEVLMRSDFFATEAFFCDHGLPPVCTENSILIDYLTESLNVSGDDLAAALFLPGPVRLALQVEEPT